MKKHFTKFLPIALAVMVATTGTSFAAYTNGSSQQKSDMSITVPEYLNIIKTTGKNESSGVTNFSSAYDTINLDTAMEADFTVYNNFPTQKIYLRATTGPDATPAIGGSSATDLYLAFSNTTSGQQPTVSDINNALATTSAQKSNKNCIAFKLTPKLGVVTGTASADAEETGATATLQDEGSNKKVMYTMNNGGYTFNYKLAQTAKDNTFSTHDTNGIYTATLYLTTVATNALEQ